jgi:hypothetical protein
LLSLFLSFFLFLPFFLSFFLAFFLFSNPSSVYPFICCSLACLFLSLSLFLFVFLCLSLCLFVFLLLYLFDFLSLSLSLLNCSVLLLHQYIKKSIIILFRTSTRKQSSECSRTQTQTIPSLQPISTLHQLDHRLNRSGLIQNSQLQTSQLQTGFMTAATRSLIHTDQLHTAQIQAAPNLAVFSTRFQPSTSQQQHLMFFDPEYSRPKPIAQDPPLANWKELRRSQNPTMDRTHPWPGHRSSIGSTEKLTGKKPDLRTQQWSEFRHRSSDHSFTSVPWFARDSDLSIAWPVKQEQPDPDSPQFDLPSKSYPSEPDFPLLNQPTSSRSYTSDPVFPHLNPASRSCYPSQPDFPHLLNPASRSSYHSESDFSTASYALQSQLNKVLDAFTLTCGKLNPSSDQVQDLVLAHQRRKPLDKLTIIAQLSTIASMITEFASALSVFR